MFLLYIVTFLALVVSFTASKEKTFLAIRIAYKKFTGILPAFLIMLMMISIILSLISEKTIINYLGDNNIFTGMLFALFLGSVTMMPGFIAFPLCGILLQKGAAYMVLSAFTTTLMMVGVLTYPIESAYFGPRVTIIRNLIGFFIAVLVSIIIGLSYGELL